eukprot:CAMPEP_0175646192 /NCGR_PEP_ID=MMETSP0097-20121207/7198_1 /TAXON_ID=311494 /ORGANISM="Alexandrium monilatum, Strain CCMP3105" /LENGTH=182 /DNA_ID=CAMNT_0016952089 /DNA_START=40 /DNA_END=588 /DNA_ORIENTATION=+
MSCSPEPPMTVWSLKISSMECSSVATLDGECEDAFFPTDVLLTVFMSTDSWPLDSGVCDCDGDVRVSGVTGEAVVGVPAVEAMMASTTSSVLQMWTRHEPVLNPLAQASALADSLLNLQKTTMRTGAACPGRIARSRSSRTWPDTSPSSRSGEPPVCLKAMTRARPQSRGRSAARSRAAAWN